MTSAMLDENIHHDESIDENNNSSLGNYDTSEQALAEMKKSRFQLDSLLRDMCYQKQQKELTLKSSVEPHDTKDADLNDILYRLSNAPSMKAYENEIMTTFDTSTSRTGIHIPFTWVSSSNPIASEENQEREFRDDFYPTQVNNVLKAGQGSSAEIKQTCGRVIEQITLGDASTEVTEALVDAIMTEANGQQIETQVSRSYSEYSIQSYSTIPRYFWPSRLYSKNPSSNLEVSTF